MKSHETTEKVSSPPRESGLWIPKNGNEAPQGQKSPKTDRKKDLQVYGTDRKPQKQPAPVVGTNLMKHLTCRKKHIRLAVVAVVAFAVYGGFTLNAADDKPKAETKPAAPKVEKKLTGAELYAVNCNRCHAERYPTEFTSAQWQTIMLHMRVRAQLPAKQAKEILKYMKEEAGN